LHSWGQTDESPPAVRDSKNAAVPLEWHERLVDFGRDLREGRRRLDLQRIRLNVNRAWGVTGEPRS